MRGFRNKILVSDNRCNQLCIWDAYQKTKADMNSSNQLMMTEISNRRQARNIEINLGHWFFKQKTETLHNQWNQYQGQLHFLTWNFTENTEITGVLAMTIVDVLKTHSTCINKDMEKYPFAWVVSCVCTDYTQDGGQFDSSTINYSLLQLGCKM